MGDGARLSRAAREAIRRIYQRRPYPNEPAEWRKPAWRLPPMEWLRAVWRRETPIGRILVAGCGTGSEAFALHRRCPDAEIVAVDFSPGSVALARNALRRSRETLPISFRVGDLADRRLERVVGRDFDLVTCHGVLSYADDPESWLRNLARLVRPDGALYLGVNGASHHSANLRAALPALGVDLTAFERSAATRRALSLCDVIQGRAVTDRVATYRENLLASDLFGQTIRNLPLAAWAKTAGRAGFHFQSSFGAYRSLRRILEGHAYEALWPRTHAEAMRIVDALVPAPFHTLLFTRARLATPPWGDRRRLSRWRPALTPLYRMSRPRLLSARQPYSQITLLSVALRTRIELRVTRQAAQTLRACDGTRTVGELLAATPRSDAAQVVRVLYGLHQLLVLRLDED